MSLAIDRFTIFSQYVKVACESCHIPTTGSVSPHHRVLDATTLLPASDHGLMKMDPAERKAIYSQSFESIPQFTPPAFVSVDTAFSLIDVSLFCQLVDYKDAHPHELGHLPYEKIYKDVRHVSARAAAHKRRHPPVPTTSASSSTSNIALSTGRRPVPL